MKMFKQNKEIFDFDKRMMKEQILEKYERQNINRKVYFKWSLATICMLLFVGCIFLSSSNNKNSIFNESSEKVNTNYSATTSDNPNSNTNSVETIINVNEIANKEIFKNEVNIKLKSNGFIPIFDELKNLVIPPDFDNTEYYEVYGKDCPVKENDVCKNTTIERLFNHKFIYKSFNNSRKVIISFSRGNEPVKDYTFSLENSIVSIIDNVEFIIYKYKNNYFANFNYNNVYYDIESNYLTEEELVMILKSIINN